MIRVEFIEGTPKTNAALTVWAENSVRRYNFWKRSRTLTQPELHAVSIATIRETSPEEVERRMKNIKVLRKAKIYDTTIDG